MPNPIALPEASTAAAPLDAEAVKRWSADPHFLESSRLWVWCRAAWPPVLLGRDAAGGQVDLQALAHAFWPWVDGLERERPYESLDALDFAHFAAGLLLYHLLQAQARTFARWTSTVRRSISTYRARWLNRPRAALPKTPNSSRSSGR